MQYLQTLFANLNIEVMAYQHQAVFTCEQANALLLTIPGAKTKNLFLKDKKGKRHFLLIVKDNLEVNLKVLAERLKVNSLSFASEQRLANFLDSEGGRVSLLDIFKDKQNLVELVIDHGIFEMESIQCHPYSNEATWVIDTQDIKRLLSHHRREYQLINVQ